MAIPNEAIEGLLSGLPDSGATPLTDVVGDMMARQLAMVFGLPGIARFTCRMEHGEVVFQTRFKPEDVLTMLRVMDAEEDEEDAGSLADAVEEEGRRLYREIYGGPDSSVR